MKYGRAGRAVSGLRAKRRPFYRPGGEAYLTIYFGIDMCKEYIHASIAQDFQDDPSLCHPEKISEELPIGIERLLDYLAAKRYGQIEKIKTKNVKKALQETLVDRNATRPLKIV